MRPIFLLLIACCLTVVLSIQVTENTIGKSADTVASGSGASAGYSHSHHTSRGIAVSSGESGSIAASTGGFSGSGVEEKLASDKKFR